MKFETFFNLIRKLKFKFGNSKDNMSEAISMPNPNNSLLS